MERREWARRVRDRVVASDPGLGRLQMAGNAVVAMATALGVEYLVATAVHAGAQGTLIAMLLGAVMAMMGSMGLAGGSVVEKVRTAVFFPVAIGVGMLAGVAVSGSHVVMLVVFVVVMFAAVFVRRFGPSFFFYGFMGWMGYFFASFLGATLAMLPGLRQLNLVAAPMTRPMLFDNDPTRVRRALTLYAAAATHSRALASQVRRDPHVPAHLAQASAALALAARDLAGLTSASADPEVLDALARADAVLFAPGEPADVGRTLIHLQQLLHQLTTSDFGSDSVLDAALVVPRREIPAPEKGLVGVVTGPSGGPVVDGAVTLVDERGSQVGGARLDRAGRYHLDVPRPGTYLVVVGAPRHDSAVARVAADPDRLRRHDVTLDEIGVGAGV